MSEELRAELAAILTAYLSWDRTMADFLGWEASLSLDSTVPADLRRDLDRLALICEEVGTGVREESEFRAIVRGTLYRIAEWAEPRVQSASASPAAVEHVLVVTTLQEAPQSRLVDTRFVEASV